MAGLAKWWDAREVPTPLLAKPEPDLKAALALLRQHGCRLVFVDTPPAASSRVSATIQEADLVLIPVQPSPDDLRAVGATVNMVESCRQAPHFCNQPGQAPSATNRPSRNRPFSTAP